MVPAGSSMVTADRGQSASVIESPTLLFNLSQAYAVVFRIDEYEKTLSRAQNLSDEEVAALSSLDEAVVVATCDNKLDLYLNGKKILSNNNHKEPRFALLKDQLKKGLQSGHLQFFCAFVCFSVVDATIDGSVVSGGAVQFSSCAAFFHLPL